jgi:hypothetical protein
MLELPHEHKCSLSLLNPPGGTWSLGGDRTFLPASDFQTVLP